MKLPYRVTVFTDGSANASSRNGGYAFRIDCKNGSLEHGEGVRDTTNNRMELSACINSLIWCKALGIKHINLYTDSMYTKNGIEKWCKGWAANGWRKADNHPVINKDLWIKLIGINKSLDVSWNWVKAHQSKTHQSKTHQLNNIVVDGNSVVDALANKYRLELDK